MLSTVPSTTRDINAVDHDGLNIFEQEILQGMGYEGNVSLIIKQNNPRGYKKTENSAFPQGGHEQCDRLIKLKHVCPWDFIQNNTG